MTFADWLTAARQAIDLMTRYLEAGDVKPPAAESQADWERAARVYTVVSNRLSMGDDEIAFQAMTLFNHAPREHRPSMLVVLANKAQNEPPFGAALLQAL